MKYISTRGQAAPLGFLDATLAGLARDGGLYVPEGFPALDLAALQGKNYCEVAEQVLAPFVAGELSQAELRGLIWQSYAGFEAEEVVPLHQLRERLYVMELFHGPTLAFKDVALQFLGNVFAHVLKQRHEVITIVGATSGDTGSAAIRAVEGRANIRIFMLHPHARVSEVQRRQMTTVLAPNVHNIAVEGSFDDCQDIVKALFNDQPFRDAMHLSAVNSINWARIAAQVVYYVYASVRLYHDHGQPVTFCVPTGNFGNVYAGYIAKRLGAPIEKLIVASNRNDILHRFFENGEMSMRGVAPSLSPSMDIQVSSNFERVLFDVCGRDSTRVAQAMQQFRATGSFTVAPDEMDVLRRVFASGRCDDAQTLQVMQRMQEAYGYAVDPHTAVGLGVAESYAGLHPEALIVSLATAHPAKFPDAVQKATGRVPQLPKTMKDLYNLPERCTVLPAKTSQIKAFIETYAGKTAPKEVL